MANKQLSEDVKEQIESLVRWTIIPSYFEDMGLGEEEDQIKAIKYTIQKLNEELEYLENID